MDWPEEGEKDQSDQIFKQEEENTAAPSSSHHLKIVYFVQRFVD